MAGRLWYIIFTSRTAKESVSSGDEDITGEPREQPERYFYERLVKLTRTKVAASRRKGREINVPPMLGGSPPFFPFFFFFFFPFRAPPTFKPSSSGSRHFAPPIFQFSRIANRSAYQIQFAFCSSRVFERVSRLLLEIFFFLITRIIVSASYFIPLP